MRISEPFERLLLGHAFSPKTQQRRITTQLPPNLLLHDTCTAFLQRESKGRGRRFLFLEQSNTCTGLAWNFGPLRFARFMSDEEPTWNFPHPKPHFLFWQQIHETPLPTSWKHSTLALHQSRRGFAHIAQSQNPLANITSHAQRHVKQFLKNDWVIEPITPHEYCDVACRSTLRGTFKRAFNNLLVEKIVGHGDLVGIVGARPKNAKVYEAAFAYVDVPEIRTSIHHVSCATAQGRAADAGSGLMAWWLERLARMAYEYADFGIFWTEGEPNTWQGFSRFKAQFCTIFHDFPQLARKKFF